jgi:hypothetical protein
MRLARDMGATPAQVARELDARLAGHETSTVAWTDTNSVRYVRGGK